MIKILVIIGIVVIAWKKGWRLTNDQKNNK